jgi:hypothetical protein
VGRKRLSNFLGIAPVENIVRIGKRKQFLFLGFSLLTCKTRGLNDISGK